jgi:hypothetical protein
VRFASFSISDVFSFCFSANITDAEKAKTPRIPRISTDAANYSGLALLPHLA